ELISQIEFDLARSFGYMQSPKALVPGADMQPLPNADVRIAAHFIDHAKRRCRTGQVKADKSIAALQDLLDVVVIYAPSALGHTREAEPGQQGQFVLETQLGRQNMAMDASKVKGLTHGVRHPLIVLNQDAIVIRENAQALF